MSATTASRASSHYPQESLSPGRRTAALLKGSNSLIRGEPWWTWTFRPSATGEKTQLQSMEGSNLWPISIKIARSSPLPSATLSLFLSTTKIRVTMTLVASTVVQAASRPTRTSTPSTVPMSREASVRQGRDLTKAQASCLPRGPQLAPGAANATMRPVNKVYSEI
jgi:hypothetical protein